MTLSKQQVKRVEYYLKSNGVESKLILGDFLDHVCCMIEQEMETGLSFEESLASASDKLPVSEIKNIESFTLKLLDMETSFSSRTALLATIPFGLFGIAWAFSNSGLNVPQFIETFFFIVAILAMFALLGIGWTKNFPRWSFPAIGFCLLFSVLFMKVSVPYISRNLLGIWAWSPLLVTLVIGLMFKPNIEPINKLFRKIKEEPALLLFALYGFAPFACIMLCDEIYSAWIIPIALVSTALLSSGLYFFLRSSKKKIRIISIIVLGILAFALSFLASYLYWR